MIPAADPRDGDAPIYLFYPEFFIPLGGSHAKHRVSLYICHDLEPGQAIVYSPVDCAFPQGSSLFYYKKLSHSAVDEGLKIAIFSCPSDLSGVPGLQSCDDADQSQFISLPPFYNHYIYASGFVLIFPFHIPCVSYLSSLRRTCIYGRLDCN